MVESSSVFKEIISLKKNLTQKCKGNDTLKARPHPSNPAVCKRNKFYGFL